MVATDGRRLAVTDRKMEINESDEGEFILPSLTVSEIVKLPQIGNLLTISYTDRQVSFELKIENENESSGFKESVYLGI